MIAAQRRGCRPVEIGIAPLVDCVFLLLVFFLLTSSFDRPRHLDVELPPSSTAASVADGAALLRVEVDREGRIVVAGRPCGLEDLEERLRASSVPGDPIELDADRRLPLEGLTPLLDVIGRLEDRRCVLRCTARGSGEGPQR